VSARAGAAPARLVAAYRQGLGLAAIALIESPQGLRLVAGEQAEGDERDALARWWCRRADDAVRLAAAVNERMCDIAPDDDAPTSRAAAVLTRAAERRRIDIWSDDEITAQAMYAIARIEAELARLRASGDLRSINKSYQAYRLEAAARGERVVPYAQWMLGYKESLVRELAATLRYL
jgi:hypothetical protein